MDNNYLMHEGTTDNNYLSHFGIKGMRWGVRRFQNEDGSLTRKGRNKYGTKEAFEKSRSAKKEVSKAKASTKDQRRAEKHQRHIDLNRKLTIGSIAALGGAAAISLAVTPKGRGMVKTGKSAWNAPKMKSVRDSFNAVNDPFYGWDPNKLFG